MHNVNTLWFDLDDTLIQTQELYNEVKTDCVRYIQQLSIGKNYSFSEIIKKMSEIDLKNVEVYGLSPVRFPTSWSETAEFFCGKNKQSQLEIYRIAQRVFTKKATIMPNTKDVLNHARSLGYQVNLLTAGDEKIQHSRIEMSNLAHFFDSVVIVPLKTPEVMKSLVTHPESSVMIGNSLKSDIHPALSTGMKAIHIERNTWKYDEHQINTSDQNYIRLQELSELKKLLTKQNQSIRGEFIG